MIRVGNPRYQEFAPVSGFASVDPADLSHRHCHWHDGGDLMNAVYARNPPGLIYPTNMERCKRRVDSTRLNSTRLDSAATFGKTVLRLPTSDHGGVKMRQGGVVGRNNPITGR